MAISTSPDMNEAMRENYEALLAGYACGALDQAQSLVVAAHLSYSVDARNYVRFCEDLAGMLIERDCSPVCMAEASLNNVLERLDVVSSVDETGEQKKASHICDIDGLALPAVLRDSIIGTPSDFRWKKLMPGIYTYGIDLPCKKSRAKLVKIDANVPGTKHQHGGMEIMLVLHGSYHDETGSYACGDMAVFDEGSVHRPMANETEGCVCLLVTSGDMKFFGWRRILNPFIRYLS